MKAGGAYLPLDPAYPPQRLAYMLADAKVSVLVTQSALAGVLTNYTGVTVQLDADRAAIEGQPETLPVSGVHSDNLAYVIYTSGSTGEPKGVMVPHRGAVNLAEAQIKQLVVTGRSRILQFASISFDAAVWELLLSWRNGATLVLADRLDLMPGEPLSTLLERQAITMVTLPPSALVGCAPARLPDLDTLIVAGEACAFDVVRPWLANRTVVDAYGPTESSVCATMYRCTDDGRISIGRPVANTQVYVLDENQEPLPAGVVGELCIGGTGLTRGYFKKPRLTARSFIPNPFAAGQRLYRTGDLARWHRDGTLQYLGRADTQVKIRGFRIELGEIEATLLSHPDVEQAVVTARDDLAGGLRLVAYVVGKNGGEPAAEELRAHLKRTLPDHMVPAAYVKLDHLPVTANGKVNRKELPAPEEPVSQKTYRAPRTSVEEALASIWRELLQVEKVGIDDNFFELGGDSIQSIQVVSRASRAGLKLTARQVFERQTIAELAEVVGSAIVAAADQGTVEGAVPLTPIQNWFFALGLEQPHHFNQAVILDAEQGQLTRALLERAIGCLVSHHDALRLRFRRDEAGWRQEHVAPDELFAVESIDLSALPRDSRSGALTDAASQLQSTLDITAGPVLRAALFDLGPDEGQRLVLIAHHLVIDGVSWRILLEDLATVCSQLRREQPVQLPAKTMSFKDWAEQLTAYGQSAAAQAELSYWSNPAWSRAERIPVDHCDGGVNTVASSRTIAMSLSEAETEALLRDVPSAYSTQINDVLLTALVEAYSKWSGRQSLLLDLEGHGREDVFGAVDLSRTVGWFTSLYPVMLDVTGSPAPELSLKMVKEQLRTIPNRGIGYGLLRFLDAPKDLPIVGSEISFNYFGQLDDGASETVAFRRAKEATGLPYGLGNRRTHLIDIIASVSDGKLVVRLTFSTKIHKHSSMEPFAQGIVETLRQLIQLGAERSGADPIRRLPPPEPTITSVKYAHESHPAISPKRMANAMAALAGADRVEDIYPLSPMQRNMLFHSLQRPGSAQYIVTLKLRIRGKLDPATFEQAWQSLIARHAALRTVFLTDDMSAPLQAVLRHADLALERHDWMDLPGPEKRARLHELLEESRKRVFELSKPPLMRVALVRTGKAEHYLVWTLHHALLDGWSGAVLLKELFATYQALNRGQPIGLDQLLPFKDYVSWLDRQDMRAAQQHWFGKLAGFAGPVRLDAKKSIHCADGPEDRYRDYDFDIPIDIGELKAFARRHRVPLNTIVQGAWALLLGRRSGRDDLIFGVTVSCRPGELPGIENSAGLFINTLPLRVKIEPRRETGAWLHELHAGQVELQDFAHSPMSRLQEWSGLPSDVPLFESVIVFENYPIGLPGSAATARSIKIDSVATIERTHHPMTVQIFLHERMSVKMIYDVNRFDISAVQAIARDWIAHMERLVASSGGDLAALLETELSD